MHDELIFETPVSQKTVVEKVLSKAMVSVSKSVQAQIFNSIRS